MYRGCGFDNSLPQRTAFPCEHPGTTGNGKLRRRGFDDDNFFGNTPTPVTFLTFGGGSSAPEMQATVKWFNSEKGYGFAALSDGSGDVFLHVNTLQAAGHQTVSSGATLKNPRRSGP